MDRDRCKLFVIDSWDIPDRSTILAKGYFYDELESCKMKKLSIPVCEFRPRLGTQPFVQFGKLVIDVSPHVKIVD